MPNDGRLNAFPSQKRLAEMSSLSVKTVQRAIQDIVEEGFLIIERIPTSNRGHFRNKYHAAIDGIHVMKSPIVTQLTSNSPENRTTRSNSGQPSGALTSKYNYQETTDFVTDTAYLGRFRASEVSAAERAAERFDPEIARDSSPRDHLYQISSNENADPVLVLQLLRAKGLVVLKKENFVTDRVV